MKKALLLFILIIAVFLRFFRADEIPPSLNWDEASLGYNAYSILKTGKDEWGRVFPLSFEAFGDYKLPGYIYTAIPFIKLFGLNEFSVRLPSQIAGVMAVFLIYLIARKIFDNENMGLFAGLLLAISPWHLFLSRVALEANLALTFFLLGLYLFLQSFKKPLFLLYASILFGLTFFTYNSARVFVSLFLVALIAIYHKELIKFRKKLILPGAVILIFILVASYFAIFQDSSSRYFWVTILDQGAINSINEARANSTLPDLITKLLNNRVVYFVQNLFLNYLKHFSLQFLFLEGGSNHQFSVPHQGLLYLIELPFLLLGFVNIFKRKAGLTLLAWVFLSPIPSAITREAPQVLRSIFMLGSLQIIISLGIITLIEKIESKIISKQALVTLLIGMLGISCFYFFSDYFINYPKNESESWQYGNKEAIKFLDQNSFLKSEKKIYITKKYGEPHIFYLFYKNYDPQKYQNSPTLIRYERTNWTWVDRLDNLYFINDWEVKDKLKNEKGAVLVTSPGNFPSGANILYSINFLNGAKAFDIVKI